MEDRYTLTEEAIKELEQTKTYQKALIELQTELDNLQSNYDRIKEAYEFRIDLMQNNEKNATN